MGIYQAEGGGGIRTYSHLSGGRRTVCEVTLVLFRRHFTSLLRLSTRQQAAAKTSAIVLTKKTVAKKSMKQHPPNSMNQSK